jgi:Tfp pilus assembly protein FimV
VQPGQTMWQIAQDAAPTADVRVTVDQIVKLNGLTNAGDLAAGDYLRVPTPSGR